MKPNFALAASFLAPVLMLSSIPLAVANAVNTATASNSATSAQADQQLAVSAQWGIRFGAIGADFTGSTGTYSGTNPVVKTIPFTLTNSSTVDLAKWTMRATWNNLGANRNLQIKICTVPYVGTVCGGTESVIQAATTTNVSNTNTVETVGNLANMNYYGLVIVTRTGGGTTGATNVTLRGTVTNAVASTDLSPAVTVSN